MEHHGHQQGIFWPRASFSGIARQWAARSLVLPTPVLRGLGQESPSRHVQIRQAATDKQPVGVFCQPTVADFGPPEDPFDHQERMFDFRPHFRLRTVTGPLRHSTADGDGLSSGSSWRHRGHGAESRPPAHCRPSRPTPVSPFRAAGLVTPDCPAHWRR